MGTILFCSPLMDEGVEAGEDEQRNHGAQRHHVVELGLQHAARVPVLQSPIQTLVDGGCVGVLQSAGEVLKKKKKRDYSLCWGPNGWRLGGIPNVF